MRVVGYLRVSTTDQDLENCRSQILHFANERRLVPVEWVTETISGTVDWRNREIGKTLRELGPGDVLITSEISRFARSRRQIIEIVELAKKRNITLHAIKGGWSIDGGMESKIVLFMLGMFAEVERDLVSLRTKEALASRKRDGVRLGRPKGPGKSRLDQYRPENVGLLRNGSPKSFVAKRYAVSEPTLYNWLAKNRIDASPIITRTA